MLTWTRTLRQAGITEPTLLAAYGQQRDSVRRFKTAEFLTVRLLLPAQLHPPIIAAVAFMHETDQRIDTGTPEERGRALENWTTATRAALEGTTATHATLRALGDAATRHPQLRQRVADFLQGAHHEINYAGFDTEDELQSYIDAYSLPAFMLLACLVEQKDAAKTAIYVQRCRDLIEAMQRVDFLDDLAEDAAHGRVGIPGSDLARHGLSVEDLRAPTNAVRALLEKLVQQQTELAHLRLSTSRQLVGLMPQQTQPFISALLQVQELRLRAVSRKGGRLADGGAHPSAPALLGVLARQYRAARQTR
ncbi:squalene/phytoene synthase family protein [Streptomyces sp. NBC_00568]|uniref:phytoene/squalene synthase family protein n=1 Tax=Streptomyces sp. NBC_00568 TaxID=2975779 RepID=UPI002254E9A4|nr:squalene/phytoene synthase family protein [Streptomyces sp. NBC_00568]MCX4993581.1 squalene/phytoene synthase family protein [Streptomyces sp. NBC_00568]